MRRFPSRCILCVGLAAGLAFADPAAPLQTPADALLTALPDAKANAANASYFRYFWLDNPANPGQERDLIATLNHTVNSLSSRKHLVGVQTVGLGVCRIDLRNYRISAEAWDDLCAHGSGPARVTAKLDAPEPYFHFSKTTTIQEVAEKLVDVPPFRGPDGKIYNQKWVKEPAGKPKITTQLLHGPWLPQSQVAELAVLTQTDFPIVRADWFLANALLPPSYQKFLGFATLDEFREQVRFRVRDEDLAVKGVVLFSSEVALHNRALLRSPTSLGYYWETSDFLTSVGEQDMLANVLSRRADAHEVIAVGVNGLQQYALTDGQNKLLDSADPNIAIDRSTGWDNKLVWNGLSCMICHSKGTKSFQDDVRKLADVNKRIFALVRPEHVEQFTDLFAPEIGGFVTRDQAQYAAAIAQVTGGLTPEKNAANLARIFLAYVQEPVTLERVAQEAGCTKDRLTAVLQGAGGLDHTLTQLLAGSPVRRDQYERSVGQLLTLLAGVKP